MLKADQKNQKRMSRSAFDALAPLERAAVMKQGVTLYDEPETKRLILRADEIFRANFEKLSPAERAAKMKAGFRLVD